MQGLIVKIISKEYTLKTEDGKIISASLAGKMRKYDHPVCGDIVEYEMISDRAIIQRYHKRKNYLIRPNLANIDQVLIVMSTRDPEFSYELCNRLIILVEFNDIKPLICVSKSDLADENEIDEIKEYYEHMGYEVFDTGLFDSASFLKDILKDKLTVLCGQSGVGKSTLLNKIDPTLALKTQAISKALNRGKHTTRHVELYGYHGGYLADTPGFSSIDLTSVDKDTLASHITAFKPYIGNCRFLDCYHINEPDCAIKEAVKRGTIKESFYATYLSLMDFLKNENLYGDRHRTLK